MMLKSKFTIFTLGVLLAHTAFSMEQTYCPDIKDIRTEGVIMVEETEPGLFFGFNISKYNTPSLWGFVIAPINAETDDEAILSANTILSTMTAPGVLDQHIICTYDTGRPDIVAAALKDDFISPIKLKEFLSKHNLAGKAHTH